MARPSSRRHMPSKTSARSQSRAAGRRRTSRATTAPDTVSSESSTRLLWRAGLILLAGALAYANSLSGPFIRDDVVAIVENPVIRAWWHPLGLLSERDLPSSGRPVVNASFALNYAFGGLDVRGYHAMNVAVHLACALLLFGSVRRTLALPDLRARLGLPHADAAFAAAILWVVHPLNTDAVDYVTQRTETMMAFFYLLTLYASIRAAAPSSWRGWQVAAVLACALGMGCKESMVTAPVMVALYDRVFLFGSVASTPRTRKRLYACLAATWLVLAALLLSGPRANSAGFSVNVTPWTYLLNQTGVIVRYLRLAIWPRALVLEYGWPLPLTLRDVWPHALIVLGLLAGAIVARIRWPRLGFLAAWFFVTLSPASSVVPIATEVGAERRMYLPLAALSVLAVIAAIYVWKLARPASHDDESAAKPTPWALKVALVLVAVPLALATAARNRQYRSSLVLAEADVARYPTSFAHHALAVDLLAAGRREEAMAHLRQAVPGAPRAHFTLAVELFRQDQFDEAIREFRAFLDAEPNVDEAPSARELLGRALVNRGRWQEAIDEYRLAVTMYPSPAQRAEVHRLWADALFAQRAFEEAVVHYRAFLEVRPADVGALTNAAIALGATNRLDEAMTAFTRAVELEPENGAARRNLANALFERGLFDQAVVQGREAVALRPADPAAHDVLGRGLAVQGRVAEAIAEFEEALRLDPAAPDVREHLLEVRRLGTRSGSR